MKFILALIASFTFSTLGYAQQSQTVYAQQFELIQGPCTIRSGSGAPPAGFGADCDLYLETGAGTLYSKVSGVWVASGGSGVSSITGTANQVIASTSTGAVTLSLPQDIATSSSVQFGKVGVGVAPTRFLDVLGTTEQLRLSNDASNYASFTTTAVGALLVSTTGTGVNAIRFTPGGTASVAVTSGVTTGTSTLSGFTVSSSTVTSGVLEDISINGTVALTNQTALNILTTGANGTTAQTTYGAQISNTHSTNTSNNVALYLNASGGATRNDALLVNAGKVGIGTLTPTAAVEVLNTTEQLRLEYDSTHYMTFTVLSSGDFLLQAGAANGRSIYLTPATTAGQVIISSVDVTGVTTASGIVLNTPSLTTGTGIYAYNGTLTSGKLIDVQVSGTAAAASQTGLNILTTGANGTAGITTYGAQISNTHSTNTSTNIALYLNASGGATANYGLIVNAGNVGIGITTPQSVLQVKQATDIDLTVAGASVLTGAVSLNAVNDANSLNIPLEIRSSKTDFSAGKVGIGTDPTYTLDVTDASNPVRLGKALVGTWNVNTAFALFGNGNISQTTAGNYALVQGGAGDTYLNAASTQVIHFRINNSEVALFGTTGGLEVGAAPTGGDKGIGTANFTGAIYANGTIGATCTLTVPAHLTVVGGIVTLCN